MRAVLALAGGTAVANATRADVLANIALTRGKGGAVAIEKTITRESVEYLEPTNDVKEDGHTQPFKQWARRETAALGASEIVAVVDTRLRKAVEGIGSGIRHLIFAPVIMLTTILPEIGTAR